MELPLYCIIGARPVKGVATADGGMDVLAYDWTTGEFVRAMAYLTTLVHPTDEDAEFVDSVAFETCVANLRASTATHTVYLRHHDLVGRLLAYESATGEFRELLKVDRPVGEKLWRGFYLTLSAHVVGIYSTARGPVYFQDAVRTPLSRARTRATVLRGVSPGVNRFDLEVAGETVARFDYTAPEFGQNPFDPYDDEEMADFFVWLTAGISNGSLFDFYVADGDDARWDEAAPSPSPPNLRSQR